jgi:predicted ABC-type ATPase
MLNDPALAVLRVRERVRKGGHSIPEQVIRRRFNIGSINFWNTYRSMCDHWVLFDNSGISVNKTAEGNKNKMSIIKKREFGKWQKLVKK